VDRNPLAVDLCRVALWLESHTAGKPLTFLDHRIRCGDSLVGVFDMDALSAGIPDKAFDACEGDDKAAARVAARLNRQERSGLQDLFVLRDSGESEAITRHSRDVDAIPDDSPELIRRKKDIFENSHRDPAWLRRKQACDLWTAAFFQDLVSGELRMANGGESADPHSPLATHHSPIITSAALADHLDGRPIDARLYARAQTLALHQPFFHWPLEFPEVFSPASSELRIANGGDNAASGHSPFPIRNSPGFDVVLSNPPWERIKLQEQEFFAARDPRIATAANKAARSRLITELIQKNPTLHAEFIAAVHAADCVSKFLRQSDRFPLTATGDINTFAVFAEIIHRVLNRNGRAGIIIPTGIATSDTCKSFFAHVVESKNLAALMSFQEIRDFFPATDSREPFCLLTLARQPHAAPQFVFSLKKVEQARDSRRRFTLTTDDFLRLNPNTRTCPIFRTHIDAELTKNIYRRMPILLDEATGQNPWKVKFVAMFHMANDSGLFKIQAPPNCLPLFEAKLIHQYDHRYATYEGASTASLKSNTLPPIPPERKLNHQLSIKPRYWIFSDEVEARLGEWKYPWLLAFRSIARSTDERTLIAAIIPRSAVSGKLPLALPFVGAEPLVFCFLASLNSLVLDFIARQKVGGTDLAYHYIKQLPVLPPSSYQAADVAYVASRVLELVYTADDMRPLFEAVRMANGGWRVGPDHSPLAIRNSPFEWNENRRALLRAELDAWYARAYGLTRDELRYILDPADVYGPDFPGETFRVLKEKEQAKYGEYRTRRLVLEAWDKLPQLHNDHV
jgi:hypothetical protein